MKRFFGFFIIVFIFLIIPSATFAESCDCFCKGDDGVENYGAVEDMQACQEYCDTFLGCYTEDQQSMHPELNTLCWTEDECVNDVETGEVIGEWAGQSNFCIKNEGLCYSEPEPVKLNVMIGSLTEAKNLGEYINAIYSFALGAGSLLAIVMIMIGGLQYMLARGNEGSITSAKKRIFNAITGIILLFASYSIANFMNPNFVTFNRLSPPRIRTVVFLDADSTCETMEKAGLEVSSALGKSCGVMGKVDSVGDVQTSVVVGAECTWTECGEMETCMGSAQEDSGYQCMRCGNAHGFGLNPSTSICARLLKEEESATDDDKYFCKYDQGMFDLGVAYTACTEIVYPANTNSLDCAALRRAAKAGDSESCRAYDLVFASFLKNFDIGEKDTKLEYEPIDDIEGDDGEFPFLIDVCASDPCGLAPVGEKCISTIIDPDELSVVVFATGLSAAPVTFGVSAWAGAVAGIMIGAVFDEIVVNCANESSQGGLWDCLDGNGKSTDCNWTW